MPSVCCIVVFLLFLSARFDELAFEFKRIFEVIVLMLLLSFDEEPKRLDGDMHLRFRLALELFYLARGDFPLVFVGIIDGEGI